MKRDNKNHIQIFSSNIDGKSMPSAPDIEEAVLGAILLEHEALDKVIDILVPEVFYLPSHQIIFNSILSLNRDKKPVDILTVTNYIRSEGHLEAVGGAYYLTQLTQRVASSANVEYHSRILLQQHMKRRMITICTQSANNNFEDSSDALDELDNLKSEISQIESLIGTYHQSKPISVITDKVWDAILNETPEILRANSFSWGLTDLDAKCPLRKPYFYVIGARPGQGKTSLIKKVVRTNSIDKGYKTLFLSLEMTSDQIVEDLISQIEMVDSYRIRNRELSGDEKHKLLGALERLSKKENLVIDDTPGMTYQMIQKRIRAEKKKGKVDIVIIDYLQLMRIEAWQQKGRNEEGMISLICNELPNIAKEENCAIILLSQLSRDVEKRNPPSPILPDFKGSGAIEANAVAALFLYRPEYYEIYQDESGNDLRGLAEIKIAKFRFGSTGKVIVRFIPEFTLFCDNNKGAYQNNNFLNE